MPHTHWDREWYHVAPRFRQRLVALVDAVLATPSVPFLLDGQAITLRDYLQVRPDAEPALRAALQAGTLEAGPWYVLADNLIPSGEAIVRNLAAGRRVLRHFGAVPPAVAYCPDTFGHPAALPTIAAGFGLTVGVVWRGLGGAAHPTTDLVMWRAPDGTALLTHHLPPDGYEFGSALPSDGPAADARWQRLRALWHTRNRSGLALLLNGADHHARQPDLSEAAAALQQAAGHEALIRLSSLSAWAEELQRYAAQHAAGHRWPTVDGELRDSYGYTWTLGGTYATRAHQKRRNARLERALLRDVEPWLALARLHGRPHAVAADARLTMAQLPTLLDRAWEDLLATHPHDTLCGCSIDAVARSMDSQQELVAAEGQGLREAALQLLLGLDPVAARAHTDLDWRRLVLRNRAPRARGGIAHVRLTETLADVPVGPMSTSLTPAPQAPAVQAPAILRELSHTPRIAQPVSSRTRFARRESPQHYPDNDRVRDHRVLLWVPPMAPYGVEAADIARWQPPESAPPVPVEVVASAAGQELRNGRIALRVHTTRDGPRVTLTVDDRQLDGVLGLETRPDAGDSYTPSLRGPAEPLRCVRARVTATGPLRAVLRLWWRTAAGTRRAGPAGALRLTTDLVVDAMSPVVQCDVRGESWRTDHRLQLVWYTDVTGGCVWADAAFGPVRRDPIVPPPEAREVVPATMPMHRWVMHASPMFGATMIGDGLAEAEVGDGRLALTLLRGVGALSRNTLPERPGHAGWPAPTPEAQCLGAFRARSALFLHGPMSDDVLARVRDVCDDVLLPLVGETWRDLRAPVQCKGVEVLGEAFELSALTVSASDEAAAVVRVVNNTGRRAWGTLRLPHAGPWEVTRCRLDETPVAEPVIVEGAFSFEEGPRGVLSVRVKPLHAAPPAD